MSSKLVLAIRKAVDKIGQDQVFIFTGQVIDVDNASSGTIRVQQITGKVSTDIQPVDQNYSFNSQYQQPINDTNDLLNTQAAPLVFDCYLQPETGDFMYVIPIVGSYVTVCHTTFQDPFIIGFQDVSFLSNSIGSTSYTMDVFGQTFSSNNTNIGLNNTSVSIGIDSGSNILINDKVDIKSTNSAEITMDSKLSIKNNSASLVDLLTDIKTCLNDISNAVIPTTIPTTLSALNPDIISQISNISTSISNLLE